eukprot:4434229-Pyramimonas_sp.AAC.1
MSGALPKPLAASALPGASGAVNVTHRLRRPAMSNSRFVEDDASIREAGAELFKTIIAVFVCKAECRRTLCTDGPACAGECSGRSFFCMPPCNVKRGPARKTLPARQPKSDVYEHIWKHPP